MCAKLSAVAEYLSPATSPGELSTSGLFALSAALPLFVSSQPLPAPKFLRMMSVELGVRALGLTLACASDDTGSVKEGASAGAAGAKT